MVVKDIIVPDLGGVPKATIIEVGVKSGDNIEIDATLITLEGEKATLDVPSPFAGKIIDVSCAVGDEITQGSKIARIEIIANDKSDKKVDMPQSIHKVTIPNLGTDSEIKVIELHVQQGDKVKEGDSILSLEGEKATMDVPVSCSGVIKELHAKVGDSIKEGDLIADVLTADSTITLSESTNIIADTVTKPQVSVDKNVIAPTQSTNLSIDNSGHDIYAGPMVRRIAREYGVNLSKVPGSGNNTRIQVNDLKAYVQSELSKPKFDYPWLESVPLQDFSKYGAIEIKPLKKIKRYTAINVHRSWVQVPHVTHFDEVDITELDTNRKKQNIELKAKGIKLTPLAFIMQMLAKCLLEFPFFNASINADNFEVILKKYINLGFAVDTMDGLVVPVIRNVEQKSITEIAKELVTISSKARDQGLAPADMAGSSFTVSSLGSIGGTNFTPIIKAPDVAILGIAKALMKPVFSDNKIVARLILPISLSYDHRVIDGAESARFCRRFAELMERSPV